MTETHVEPKPWHKNWPPNVPKTIQYPLTPLHELLEMSAEKRPTHPAKVAAYKAIREIEFRNELPMTPVGKVLRRALRQEEQEKKRD